MAQQFTGADAGNECTFTQRRQRRGTPQALCIMSKITSPPDKKRVSLARDRRNTYGESPHAARKNIPKRKAERHQQERHVASLLLSEVLGNSDPSAIESIEGKVESRSLLKRRGGFKKFPDRPLGEVIELKRKRRIVQTGKRKRGNA